MSAMSNLHAVQFDDIIDDCDWDSPAYQLPLQHLFPLPEWCLSRLSEPTGNYGSPVVAYLPLSCPPEYRRMAPVAVLTEKSLLAYGPGGVIHGNWHYVRGEDGTYSVLAQYGETTPRDFLRSLVQGKQVDF